MNNPMLNQLGRSLPSNLNQIKQMANMFKNAKNPQMLIQNMMMQNPQMKQVMDFINQNGGDAKSAFYKLADQRGVDPNEILNMLKGDQYGYKFKCC